VKKLFVGNLPFQASETELQNWFAEAGITVETVNLVRDRNSGQPRGFGFVELNDDEAERAITTLNGRDFLGRPAVVNEARPRESSGFRGDSGGRGGHGGRGGPGGRGGRGRSW